MDYAKINNKITELKNSGQFDNSQLEAIKYACYMPNFDENLIIDPSIPGNIMLTYVKLANNKIDISKYINSKWHLKGFDDKQLYCLISYYDKGYDISNITPNMSIEEIKDNLNDKIDENEKNELLNNPELEPFKKYNLDLKVIKFFLKKIQSGDDISIFLRPNINKFSFEQIKYLFAVYSTGSDINKIFDPNLSIEQMRNIIVNSPSSIDFLQEVMENHNDRKK